MLDDGDSEFVGFKEFEVDDAASCLRADIGQAIISLCALLLTAGDDVVEEDIASIPCSSFDTSRAGALGVSEMLLPSGVVDVGVGLIL